MSKRKPQFYRVSDNYNRSRSMASDYKPARRARSGAYSGTRTGGFLNKEVKFADSTYSATTALNDTWGVKNPDNITSGCINGCAVGNNVNERDGNRIVVKSIHIRGSLKLRGGALAGLQDATPPVVKLAVVMDTQTNKAQTTAGLIYNVQTGITGGRAIDYFRNLEQSSRFKVLKYITVEFDPQEMLDSAGTGMIIGGQQKEFGMDLKKLDIPVQFDGDTAKVTDIVTNSIHFLAVASEGNSDPWKVQLAYLARMRFIG